MSEMTFLIRICCCFLFSFIIGLERQWRRRIIGLRTNVLVSLGAFLFVALSVELTKSDPTRIAAQVVSGIGFLGAGVILKDGTRVKGLNTAATLWCNAAIGVLCAYGLISFSFMGTLFILICNIVLRIVTLQIVNRGTKDDSKAYMVKIGVDNDKEIEIRNNILQKFNKEDICLKSMITKQRKDGNNILQLEIYIDEDQFDIFQKVMKQIGMLEGIIDLAWMETTEQYNLSEMDEV